MAGWQRYREPEIIPAADFERPQDCPTAAFS
jgi:hypothetical protein